MRQRFVQVLLMAVTVFGSNAIATPLRDPGSCPRDSKLIGPVSVWGDEFEDSWWNLTFNGMLAAGLVTNIEQRDYLNAVFGTDFATLAEVRDFNLQLVADGYDKNGNGVVCAYAVRGTRAYNTDPFFAFTVFGVSDDKMKN